MSGAMESIGNAVGGLVGSITGANDQIRAQERAAKQAELRAAKDAELRKQEINRANAKTPDISGFMDQAQAASKLGAQGTILTGPGGVDENDLTLGKNVLLGG